MSEHGGPCLRRVTIRPEDLAVLGSTQGNLQLFGPIQVSQCWVYCSGEIPLIPLTRWRHGAKSEQRTQTAGHGIHSEKASATSHVTRQFFYLLSCGKGCGIGAGINDYEGMKKSKGKLPRPDTVLSGCGFQCAIPPH